jgi:rhodanese-related sulfurtransferase
MAYNPDPVVGGDFRVTETRERLIADTEALEEAVRTGTVQLADCRTEDFYLGLNFKRKFVAPEHKGHLDGAKTLPFVLLADNSGPARLFPRDQVQAVARLKGIDLEAPTIAYCNTGTTASLGWFALHEILGNRDTKLYDGSMHAWSTLDPAHPVVALDAADDAASDAADELASTMTVRPALPTPPPSLQTLVDERRDALRRRRNARFDAVTGRALYRSPMIAALERMSDDYRDARRAAQRRHRDAVRLHQDTMRDVYAPWTRPYHEAAEMRHFLSQMRQLDREEILDGYRFTYGYPPW